MTELPRIAAHITEYRCHRRQCPDCGTIPLAPLPDEPTTQFGPQLTALIAYLTVVCRMPRLVVQRFLEGALQIPISLGSTQNAWEETSAAVAAPYAELEAALPHELVINADETGHRTNGDKRWLWTFVARTFVLYRIAASRGSDVLQMVLGETFAGILGSDRLPAYLKYVVGQRQFCWAHVTRNLLSALDLATTPAAKRFCREALALDRRLFRLWHRFRGDPSVRGSPLTRAELIAKVLPIEKRLFALGERYLNAANADVRNLAYAFFVHNQHLFTFVHEEGVEPTNNVAERALRTAVQWRKIMFGTRSDQGERAVARLLTIVRTCQPGHKNRRQVSESTVRRERGLLQSIFERAIDEGYDIRNPFRGIKRGKDKPRTRVLTLEEETLLLEALHPRFQRFVRFALGTGCRLDEIRGIVAFPARRSATDPGSFARGGPAPLRSLAREDVDWLRGTVHVIGKFRKERDVPMQPDARAALEEQLEAEGKLWTQNPQRLREVLAEGCARARIPVIGPHVLRHTFGTRWLQAGGDIYKLSKILGHSSVAVTEAHYAHLLKEDLVAASQHVKIPVAQRGTGNVVRMPRRRAGTSQ